MILPPQPP
jgi:hypothetical protein